jgi:biotin carboxylase
MKLLLVNPLSSANYLSDSLRELGLDSVALYTRGREGYDAYTQPAPSLFGRQVFCAPDAAAIVELLDGEHFDYVLNGSESTGRLTDELAAALTPGLGNIPGTAPQRSDKFSVQQRLADVGLPHIRQRLVPPQRAAIESELACGRFDYPFFLKPLKGVGSKGAMRIGSPADLDHYFGCSRLDTLRRDLTVFCEGDSLSHLLVGEYVDGVEYFVDSFSFDGRLHISSIQRYCKEIIDGSPMCRWFEVVQDDAPEAEAITSYVAAVFKAVGVRNGFAHTELFMTSTGPVLIELNPRIGGLRGYTNFNTRLAGRLTQPELLAAALRGHTVKDGGGQGHRRVHSRALTLFNFAGGALPDFERRLAEFTSVRQVGPLQPPGTVRAEPPRSVSDIAAVVFCAHEDADVLERETRCILDFDVEGWSD